MKITRFAFSALAVLACVSCSREVFSESEEGKKPGFVEGKTYITVGMPDTKTILGEADASGVRKVYWQNGDKINVNGAASEALAGVDGESSSALFEFSVLLDYPYNLMYPASAYKEAGKVTFPATQNYTAGSFDPAAAISVAYAADEAEALILKHTFAVVKVPVKLDTDDCALLDLTFTGKGAEQVSGDFSVDYTTAALTSLSEENADKKIVMDISSITLSAEATDIYIVVPAGSYEGFNIRIRDVKGHYMDQAKASAITLEAGKVYNLPTVSYVPTGTLVTISNADEYLAFAQDFKKGVYGSKDSKVVVDVTGDLDFADKTFDIVDSNTYIFSGTWNGNSHLMKNITATNVAVFYTPTNAIIKDIVIDSSCSFTKTSANIGYWGIIARSLNGADSHLSGCTINCDWNFDYGASTSFWGYGAVSGRNDGIVENCVMNGNVIYTRTSSAKVGAGVYVGGIIGYNHADAASGISSVIRNCTMNGNLVFNEPDAAYRPVSEGTNKFFNAGGVLGHNQGTAEYLKMYGDVLYQDYVLDAFVGGVIGNSDGPLVDHCEMYGNISTLQPEAKKADGYARLFVGGVIGRCWNGTLSNCTNLKGKVVSGSSQTNNMDLGGIVGSTGTTVIKDCVNNMTVQMNDKGAFYSYLGGIVAALGANSSMTNVENNGPINVGVLANASGAQTHVGGVAGHSASVMDGGTITDRKSSIHNNAQILCNAPHACTGFTGANFGGVVGRLDASASNLTNSGKVYLNFGDDTDQNNIMKYVAGGGIVGRIPKAITLDGCINSGRVQLRYWTKAANNTKINYVGGIVGCVLSGAAGGGLATTIRNCVCYGDINSSNNNTTYPAFNGTSITQGKMEGGIIGVIFGADESKRAVVENCTSASSTANSIPYGYFGGVVGMARYTDITGCVNKTEFKGGAGNGCTLGGILGITHAKVVVRGCEARFKATNFAVAGGIVGACNTGSPNQAVIEDNIAELEFTTTLDKPVFGAVARNPVAATVVQNNGIKGSFNGKAFSADYAPYTYSGTFTCAEDKPNYVIIQ